VPECVAPSHDRVPAVADRGAPSFRARPWRIAASRRTRWRRGPAAEVIATQPDPPLGMSDQRDRMGSDRALPSPKAKAVAVAVDKRLAEPRGPEPIGEARWIDRLEHVADV